MCGCDHDPPTFYSLAIVRGRKEYRCAECLRQIAKGEEHESASGLWEGHFETFRTCQACLELRESMDLECFCHGQLMDDVSNADELTEEMIAFRDRRDENYRRIQAERSKLSAVD